jgi:hypothetical protein
MKLATNLGIKGVVCFHTSIVKNMWEECKFVEKVLKLSHVCMWYVNLTTTKETTHFLGSTTRNQLMDQKLQAM